MKLPPVPVNYKRYIYLLLVHIIKVIAERGVTTSKVPGMDDLFCLVFTFLFYFYFISAKILKWKGGQKRIYMQNSHQAYI